jgi:poly-gamma-glutamate synthesis protein (capsule biosynthesis protein)
MTSGQVIIHAVGDVSPRRYTEYEEPAESLFGATASKIQEADISFCQLECNLSTSGSLQYRSGPTTWYGRTHPDNVKILKHAGFDLVTHASNHCFDYGPESLVETIDVLRNNGIEVAGVGRDLDEARRPVIMERNGTRVAFLNFCAILPDEYEARQDKAGCAPLHVATYYQAQEYQPGTPPTIITIPRESDVQAIEADVRAAKANADVVVMCFHWGIHHIPGMLADYESVVAKRVIDAGADIVIGTHAHVVKGIETYAGKVIFHSLGDFAQEKANPALRPPGVFRNEWRPSYGHSIRKEGYRHGASPDRRYTFMVRIVIEDRRIARVSFVPGWIDAVTAQPRLLTAADSEFPDVVEYVTKWCDELGTKLVTEGDEVVVQVD